MVFAISMATLYPGIEIVVASSSVKTAKEFMKKINELLEYPNVAQEIKKDGIHFGKEESSIILKNDSTILSKVCNENARGELKFFIIYYINKSYIIEERIMNGNKWTQDEIDFIMNNYKDKTAREIGNILGRSKSSVNMKINRLGLEVSKYHYNIDYFQEIDTEEKAYWLGFLYADGNVCFNEIRRNYCVSIELKASDEGHLKKFNKAIEGNIELSYRYSVSPSYKERLFKICCIRIFNKKMCNDLIKLGCIPNKTFFVKIPTIREDLIWHFIRGFFDGDGSIYKRSDRKGIFAKFTSASPDMINGIRNLLYENNINTYITHSKNSKAMDLYVSGRKNSLKFFNLIYKDCTIYLDRKYEIYKNEVATLFSNK